MQLFKNSTHMNKAGNKKSRRSDRFECLRDMKICFHYHSTLTSKVKWNKSIVVLQGIGKLCNSVISNFVICACTQNTTHLGNIDSPLDRRKKKCNPFLCLSHKKVSIHFTPLEEWTVKCSDISLLCQSPLKKKRSFLTTLVWRRKT